MTELITTEAFGILELTPNWLRVFPGTMLTQRSGTVHTWRR
jgi:hypothetical protein